MSAGLLRILENMKHSPLQNYGGIPGLTSWLIGSPSEHGLVRLMECSRDHFEPIIPHSHRFHFRCLVLAGKVTNLLWHSDVNADLYQASTLKYSGTPGCYEKSKVDTRRLKAVPDVYNAGDEYEMTARQIHSIFFAKGTSVLFFEGPMMTEESVILEPIINGELVPTFCVPEWAFKKPESAA